MQLEEELMFYMLDQILHRSDLSSADKGRFAERLNQANPYIFKKTYSGEEGNDYNDYKDECEDECEDYKDECEKDFGEKHIKFSPQELAASKKKSEEAKRKHEDAEAARLVENKRRAEEVERLRVLEEEKAKKKEADFQEALQDSACVHSLKFE